ncbi:MAG: GntR family transcriptional regulator [Lachnospiraceae bacterium]|nr:FadR family transcriptional regulator [Lachnospiraceae bacterium]MEE1014578.1 GntR family transcriptional regulator [Lachnospiraceae bacterium]
MQEKIKLQPIVKKSLYVQISDAIYSYIRTNQLQPGDKLPSEREMASILGTSRNSLREGLHILENKGLLEIKSGSGTFVKNPYGSANKLSIHLNGCSKEEIYQLQTALEQQMVKNVFLYATTEEKQELLDRATEMSILAESYVYSHAVDTYFHNKLYEIARNTAIRQLLDSIRAVRFSSNEENVSDNNSIWLASVKDHYALAQAIVENNETTALEALDRILKYSYEVSNNEQQ